MSELLPLFVRGKLGTSKIDCVDKIQKKSCLFTEIQQENTKENTKKANEINWELIKEDFRINTSEGM